MEKVRRDGYEEHSGLIEEALEYFLLDVLSDTDFERVKKDFK